MNETLRIVRHLYGEEPNADDLEQRLREDPGLAQELDEMREVKAMLDKKSSQRPDASVIDAIVAEAARATSDRTASDASGTDSLADRSPEPRTPRDRPARERPIDEHSADERPAQRRSKFSRRLQQASLAAALILVAALGVWQFQSQPADDTSAVRAQTDQQLERQLPPAVRDLPDWDEGDDVVRLHRRLEVVNARSAPSPSWNDSPGFIPAQSRRP